MDRASVAVHAEGERALSTGTLLRVFFRSLLLQASWNPRGMQNLGFAFAMEPALARLYPDPAQRARAVQRHMAVFNTHPYMASAILGGALYHEVRVARGASPESVERFKQALMGPMAAVGDSFFWLSLRPFAGVLAAVMAPLVGAASAVIFLVLYNVPHLWLRVLLFVRGYQGGDRVVETVARASLPRNGARLRRVTATMGGVSAAVAVLILQGRLFVGPPTAPLLWSIAAAAVVFFACYRVLGRRGPVLAGYLTLAVAALLAIVEKLA